MAMVALALRGWHVGHGLPDFTEEAFVFRRALDMWSAAGGTLDLNPQSFVYPSLTIYLHLAVQHLVYVLGPFDRPADFLLQMLMDPSAAVIAARCVGIAADVVTLVTVGLIGRRFGPLASVFAMGIVAFATTMIATSRLLFTDSMMAALAVLTVHRILVYVESTRRRHLLLAGVLLGLATGAKYPAVLLLLPLAFAVWRSRMRWNAMRELGIAAGVAGVTFILTTPYLLVSGAAFVRDAVFLGDVTSGGLGKPAGTGIAYYLSHFSRNVSWIGCVLFAWAVMVAARHRDSRLVILLLAWLVMLAPVAVSAVEAERYLVPVVAFGAALVGAGAEAILRILRWNRPSRVWRIVVVMVLLLGVLGQVGPQGIRTAAGGSSTTQIEARIWCESYLRDDELLLSEVNGPHLLTYGRRAQVEASEAFQLASPSLQAAYRGQRWSAPRS